MASPYLTPETIAWLVKGGVERTEAFFANDTYLLQHISPFSWGRLLHRTVDQGDITLLAYLLKARPDLVDAPHSKGRVPFAAAVKGNKLAMVGMFVLAGSKETDNPEYLDSSIAKDRVAMTETLLRLRPQAQVNTANYSSLPPLFMVQSVAMTKMLLDVMDADPNLIYPVSSFQTPLTHILRYGDMEIAELLLERGARVDLAGPNGLTPLHLVAAMGLVSTVQLYLQKGANAAAVDVNGVTALHAAMGASLADLDDIPSPVPSVKIAIAKMLVAAGCPVEAINREGESALFCSCYSGHLPLVTYLYQQGPPELLVKSNEAGDTPLMVFVGEAFYKDALGFFQLLGPSRLIPQLELPDSEEVTILEHLAQIVTSYPYPGETRDTKGIIKAILALGVIPPKESIWKLKLDEFLLTEDERAEIRYQIYFSHSLTSRLLPYS